MISFVPEKNWKIDFFFPLSKKSYITIYVFDRKKDFL